MAIYKIICTKEWKILGEVEANSPLEAIKKGMVQFNTSHAVAVHQEFKSNDN